MPSNDAFNWPFLLYVATVILKRPEREFWRMTPRKLKALTNVHIKFNAGNQNSKPSQQGYIDHVM